MKLVVNAPNGFSESPNTFESLDANPFIPLPLLSSFFLRSSSFFSFAFSRFSNQPFMDLTGFDDNRFPNPALTPFDIAFPIDPISGYRPMNSFVSPFEFLNSPPNNPIFEAFNVGCSIFSFAF